MIETAGACCQSVKSCVSGLVCFNETEAQEILPQFLCVAWILVFISNELNHTDSGCRLWPVDKQMLALCDDVFSLTPGKVTCPPAIRA